jgi:hypothetical protein
METIREIKNSVETSAEIRHREKSSKRSVTGTAGVFTERQKRVVEDVS